MIFSGRAHLPPTGLLPIVHAEPQPSARNDASLVRGTRSVIVFFPKFLSCAAYVAGEEFPRCPIASLLLRRGIQRLLGRRCEPALLQASTTHPSNPAQTSR